ncbi:hypothetical protein A1O1_02144 [Capronia coronata CBS 617.96]|uniref:2-oxoadipate dioxygenase/decarboxylase n=1 Tax=Capronia coronata CBS 617.96 TaxID=1182541 RepID=W9YWT7_9EURO|nr:uncharacterized protein A1O1_02144 [Capronia coronata CBS 617.96]EXJ93751.1 hypothetical protein A1O1_02144 [Capronia coronata CBS 617.96]
MTQPDDLVEPRELRSWFAASMSELYRKEVPLYSSLLDVVSKVNQDKLKNDAALRQELENSDSLARLGLERHGAIRLGSDDELVELTAFLRLLDMHPVGYYDLSAPPAHLPIHATCFRSVTPSSLKYSPFRLFVSILRPDLLPADPSIRQMVQTSIRSRKLFPPEVAQLVAQAALHNHQLPRHSAEQLIKLAIPSFAFHARSALTSSEYALLAKSSLLLADIVAFPNPHINHLTPRTLDIDAVQDALVADPTFEAKAGGIEGPPPSKCPILLRQTSFCAVEETVPFSDGTIGKHAARFGEIEQRGAAVTPAGRALYDKMLASNSWGALLDKDWEALRTSGLIWVQYRPVPGAQKDNVVVSQPEGETLLPTIDQVISQLLADGKLFYAHQIYEDFLPLSAAGIFQSNLGTSSHRDTSLCTASSPTPGGPVTGREQLQDVLARAGAVLRDEMEVYKSVEEQSKRECVELFGIKTRD